MSTNDEYIQIICKSCNRVVIRSPGDEEKQMGFCSKCYLLSSKKAEELDKEVNRIKAKLNETKEFLNTVLFELRVALGNPNIVGVQIEETKLLAILNKVRGSFTEWLAIKRKGSVFSEDRGLKDNDLL